MWHHFKTSKTHWHQRLALGLIGSAVCMTIGCATPQMLVTKSTSWLPTREPTKIVLVVTQARMDENGSSMQQGMLCRAYFFHKDDPIPVKATGDLVFTAYDQSKEGADRMPEGLYEIAADNLQNHLRPDIVGDSYLFWLPFEPRQKTQVAVQGKLTLANKQVVSSGVVNLELLPPMPLPDPNAASQAPLSWRERLQQQQKLREVSSRTAAVGVAN